MSFLQANLKIFTITAVFLLACPFAAFGKAAIEGTIVNLYGGALEGATVQLKGDRPEIAATAVSGSDGRYRIGNLDGGIYDLTVTLQGFVRERVSIRLFADEVTHRVIGLEVGRLTDAEPIFISGVIQSEGKPLSDVVVTVRNAFNERKSDTAKTDKSGRYKIEIFDGGQYIITAFRPGFEVGVETKIFDTRLAAKRPLAYHVDLSLTRFRDS